MRALAVTTACILLAACGSGDDDQRTASGQVLEGSISDAMLPLDSVRSHPPLMAVTGTPNPNATGTEAPPEPEATDAPESADGPAPSASATPSVAE
jgi:hypothetical protein